MASSIDRGRPAPAIQSRDPTGSSRSTSDQRPPDVEPFLAGCAFPSAPGVPYPRAQPADAGRLPADTWATASIPVGVRLELTGDAEAVEIEYETATAELGYRGEGAGTTFTSWRGLSVLDDVPAVLGRGRVTLRLAADPGPADGGSGSAGSTGSAGSGSSAGSGASAGSAGSGASAGSPDFCPGNADAAADRWVVTLPEGMRPSILGIRGVGGTVRPAPAQPRWLCYGDSIAEGWAASNPGRAWPAIAARRYGLDVVNLGYAGAARGEMVSAEEIAGIAADVISLSYGTNCWTRIQHSAEQVGAGLDAFIDLVRSGHPHTPIVVASPVIRPDAEDQPNRLGATLGALRSVIEARIERREASDPQLHLVRGGPLLVADQLADGVHPGDEGHRILAQAIGSAVRASLDAQGGTTSAGTTRAGTTPAGTPSGGTPSAGTDPSA